MGAYDSFQDSMNGALRGGALLQGILHKSEEREFNNQVRRADEFARGLDGLTNKYGSPNPKDYDDTGRALFNDLLNEYPELSGERPEGPARYDSIEPAGDGVAAVVTVTRPDGTTTTGPITENGTTEDDDPVVILNDVDEQLKKPIAQNLRAQRATMAARMRSTNASKIISARENQQNETNALEGLWNRTQRIGNPAGAGASDPASGQGVVPAEAAVPQGLSAAAPQTASAPAAPAAAAPAPVQPAGPAADQPQGLAGAVAPMNPPAVTSPGPQPISTPVAAPRIGNVQGRVYTGTAFAPEVDGIVSRAADAAGVDVDLYRALVQTESNGKIDAKSPIVRDKNGKIISGGAQGLAQITGPALIDVNKKLGKNYTRADMLADPAKNAEVGATYLRMMLDQHDGNVEQALAAYNGGAGHLKKAGGDYTKTRPETAAYVPKVMGLLGEGAQEAAAPQGLAQAAPQAAPTAASADGTRDLMREQRAGEEAPTQPAAVTDPAASGEINREPTEPFVPKVPPKGREQKKIMKEAKESPKPNSVAEVKEAVAVVQAKKPSEVWTKEERNHLYTLHRLNPSQMPIDTILTAFRTGRVGTRTLKTFQNAAGQVISLDENNVETVVGDTPEAQRIQNLTRQKSEQDLLNKQLDTSGKLDDKRAKQLALTKGVTDFQVEQAESIHENDPDRVAQFRNQMNVTIDNLGFDATSQNASTMLNLAPRLQEQLAITTADWIPHWAGGDATFDDDQAGDYSFGMAIVNAPSNPNDINDLEGSLWGDADDAAQWVHNNYFEPMKEMHPGLASNQVGQASYLATEMTKMSGGGKPSDEILKQAGLLIQSGRYDNVAEILAVMKERAQFKAQ